jgi:hypothetical protein
MRRQIQELPTELPHASLYLDDLEAIAQVLTDEILEKLQAEADADPDKLPAVLEDGTPAIKIETLYQIGHEEMDAIADLAEQGGSTKHFQMSVETPFYQNCSLHFDGTATSHLFLRGFNDKEQWALYGKVRAIFEGRRAPLKNLITHIPASLIFVMFVVIVSGPFVLDLLTLQKIVVSSLTKAVLAVGWGIVAFMVLSIGVSYSLLPDRIYLVRSHERSRAASEIRRQRLEKGVSFVLGGIVTELLHYIAKVLK